MLDLDNVEFEELLTTYRNLKPLTHEQYEEKGAYSFEILANVESIHDGELLALVLLSSDGLYFTDGWEDNYIHDLFMTKQNKYWEAIRR